MGRVVFFGMSGGFSCVSLRALITSGNKPVLVVHGLDPALAVRGPIVERERASAGGGSFFSRLFGAAKAEAFPPTIEESPPGPSDSDLTKVARAHGIDTLRTTDANAARCRAAIKEAEPDAFVIAGFPQLLSPELLKIPKRGGLNLHPGRLPDERGPSPLFWTLRDGKAEVDFTVHVLDAGEDTGDIVSIGTMKFPPGTPGLEVLTACARVAAPQLLRALRGLLDGDLVRTPQPKGGGHRRPRPAFKDGRIDATKSAEAVFTFVGGCAAAFSIFAEVANDRFFIRRAVSYDMSAGLGFEYVLTGDRLILRCNPGIVELELKEEGALFSAEYEGEEHGT